MGLSDQQLATFETDGFMIVRDGTLEPLWLRAEAEISDLVEFFSGRKLDIFHHGFEEVDESTQSAIYDRLSYLPVLAAMESDETILDWCREFGLGRPILMGCSNMRYDRPENQKRLTNWHQDSTYLLGSLNALTVWIPFSDVNEHYGSIAVIPGSHRGGIKKFKRISSKEIEPNVQFLTRDIALDESVPVEDEVIIEAKRGDLVVFKQMLLHRSVDNKSDRIRWSAQLRFSDLSCPTYQRNNFKNGDRHNIFETAYPGFTFQRG